ncbi:hypothetical protein ACJJTC_018515 [Scirpophaga incertulas]
MKFCENFEYLQAPYKYYDPPDRSQGSSISGNGTFKGTLGLIWKRRCSLLTSRLVFPQILGPSSKGLPLENFFYVSGLQTCKQQTNAIRLPYLLTIKCLLVLGEGKTLSTWVNSRPMLNTLSI